MVEPTVISGSQAWLVQCQCWDFFIIIIFTFCNTAWEHSLTLYPWPDSLAKNSSRSATWVQSHWRHAAAGKQGGQISPYSQNQTHKRSTEDFVCSPPFKTAEQGEEVGSGVQWAKINFLCSWHWLVQEVYIQKPIFWAEQNLFQKGPVSLRPIQPKIRQDGDSKQCWLASPGPCLGQWDVWDSPWSDSAQQSEGMSLAHASGSAIACPRQLTWQWRCGTTCSMSEQKVAFWAHAKANFALILTPYWWDAPARATFTPLFCGADVLSE